MSVKGNGSYGLIVLLVLLGLAVAGFTPTPEPVSPDELEMAMAVVETATAMAQSGGTPTPAVGEVWTRPADGMEMVYVPAGEFQMGSTDEQVDQAWEMCEEFNPDCRREDFEIEQPAHTVALDGLWLDRTEVTNEQYRVCVEAGVCDPSEYEDTKLNDENQPMVGVDWYDAEDYCQWAGARLPTEAEWEYAARGPEGRAYPWGDTFDGTKLNFCDKNCLLDHADKSVDDGYLYPAPVGSYPDGASWCGALDMAGNVWEWVADWYGEYPSGKQVNPTGPASGVVRVLRGGSWFLTSDDTRGANRGGGNPDYWYEYVGFRCARSS